MKTSTLCLTLLWLAWSATALPLPAQEQAPTTANPHEARAKELADQLGELRQRMDAMETLRQEHEHPRAVPASRHVYLVRLDRGIEVVTESHTEYEVTIQKDYFIRDSKVYAHRVSVQEVAPDGRNKRVANSYFLFHEGNPIHRSQVVARVPVDAEEPDLSKAKEREVPLPPGLEGWGDQLTARAFSIARTFRPGIGRYAFGDWDAWLLKHAPPAVPLAYSPQERGADWLPDADTLVLPVEASMSPDDLYEIGWGFEKGPVPWRKLAYMEDPSGIHPYPTFSTKLVDRPLPADIPEDRNFLLNRRTGKPLVMLGLLYPGERQRFNHDELIANWSPASACVVVRAEQKWFTEYAEIAWIADGKCDATFDILKPLEAASVEAVKKSKHPAARRIEKDEEGNYFHQMAISKLLVEDDGAFQVKVISQIPKDDVPGGYYEVEMEGTFTPGEKGGPAKLKVTKARVLPFKR